MASVIPAATPVLVSVPSPSVPQGLSSAPLPLPTVSEAPTITSRTTLPDFIVGGYKVKSDRTGDP